MSGFFSLSSGKEQEEDHQQQQNNSSLFLFKNEEIYSKGFELWQQYYQLHQQRLQQQQQQNHHHTTIQDVDFSVGPSKRNNNIISSINGDEPWNNCSNSRSAAASAGFKVMRQSRGGNEGMNCQDCGNQAKKDCTHSRCRTCCKSRGFHCQTHVKSTWVPAAKRRERQQQLAAAAACLHQNQPPPQLTNPKRLRENPGGGGGGGSTLACTTSRLPASTSGFELEHFPPELNSPATFRCVRVTAMDDADEHLAYQTAVNIGGHVFRGILYDQGPESRYPGGAAAADQSSSGQQPLDLIAATTATTHVTMHDPSIYPTPLSAFMAGTQFFPPPRP